MKPSPQRILRLDARRWGSLRLRFEPTFETQLDRLSSLGLRPIPQPGDWSPTSAVDRDCASGLVSSFGNQGRGQAKPLVAKVTLPVRPPHLSGSPRCIVCILIMVIVFRGTHGAHGRIDKPSPHEALWRLAGCATEGLRTPNSFEPATHGRERRPTDVGRAGLYISSLIDARIVALESCVTKDRRIEDGDVEMSPGTLGASPQQFDPSLADQQSPPIGRDRCGTAILIRDSPIFERIGEAESITRSTRTT
jgi:hypothetical protein